MSSPTEQSPETSVSVSSPAAAEHASVDSASSTRRVGALPNVTFETRLSDVRARSVSPRMHRTVSPSSLSVAQQRVRTAEQRALSALSSVGVIANQTQRTRAVAEAAIAEARSVREEVSSKISEVAKRANVSASSIAENLEGKMREVAAYTGAQTSHAVGDLQSKTREYVEGQRRDLEARIEQSRVEAQQTTDATKAAVDQLSTQLAQLVTQLAEGKPARSVDVATGQAHLTQGVDVRLQSQSLRIDTISDSIQRIERDSADNTKLLHELIVNMENLGDSIKYMKAEMAANWEQEETPMEMDGDRQYQGLQDELLAEVSQSFPHTTVNPSVTTPLSMPVPVSIPILTEASSSSLPEGADEQMRQKLDALRMPAEENPEKEQKDTSFRFDTPASMTLPYPGLDGHQRRITPIPMSIPEIPISTVISPGQGKQAFAATMQSLVNQDMESAQFDPDRKLTFEEEIEQRRKENEEAMSRWEKASVNVNAQKSVKNLEKGGIAEVSGSS